MPLSIKKQIQKSFKRYCCLHAHGMAMLLGKKRRRRRRRRGKQQKLASFTFQP